MPRAFFKFSSQWKQLQHEKQGNSGIFHILSTRVNGDLSPGNLIEATGKLPSDRPAHSQASETSIQLEGLETGADAGHDDDDDDDDDDKKESHQIQSWIEISMKLLRILGPLPDKCSPVDGWQKMPFGTFFNLHALAYFSHQ